MVDWHRGYKATTPCALRPWASRPFVRCHLVPSIISRGALCQATPETSVSEERKWARNVRTIYSIICDFHSKLEGSLTCRKSATWGKRLYFPSEGRHAEDFFTWKIWRLWLGANPRSWVPDTSMLTTRPPKPLGWEDNFRPQQFYPNGYNPTPHPQIN
jgi:hypothetical protein